MTRDPAPGWPDFWDLYEAGDWEPATRELLDEFLAPGRLFVDIGAWIGPVTLWALELGADVVAVEPDYVAVQHLRRNTSAYGTQVRVIEEAVTVRGGPAYVAAPSGRTFGESETVISHRGALVRSSTLYRLLEVTSDDDRVPALVKIDVEGYEKELMPSIGPWLVQRGIPTQVSLHGIDPETARAWFPGAARVDLPADDRGDVVMRP